MQNTEIEKKTDKPTTPITKQQSFDTSQKESDKQDADAPFAQPGDLAQSVNPAKNAERKPVAESKPVSQKAEVRSAKGRRPRRVGKAVNGTKKAVPSAAAKAAPKVTKKPPKVARKPQKAARKAAGRRVGGPVPGKSAAKQTTRVVVGSDTHMPTLPRAFFSELKELGKWIAAKRAALPKMPDASKVMFAIRKALRSIKKWPALIRENLFKIRDWFRRNVRLLKLIVPVALLCAYVLCSLLFSTLFMPGTTINGRNASLRSAKSVATEAQEIAKEYTLTANGDGLSLDVRGADIDLAVDADAYRSDAASHLFGWAWPIGLFFAHEHEVATGITYSKEKVRRVVELAVDSVNEDAVAPKDAFIAYDDSKNSFVAQAEKEGTVVSCDSVVEVVEQGISTMQEQVDLGSDVLVQPSLVADGQEMEAAIQEANRVADLDLVLTVDNKKYDTVSKDLIRSWMVLGENYHTKADLEAITAWAREDLSLKIDTINATRTYTRANDGKRIDVFGGTYGWNVDSAELAKLICKRLEEASDEPVEIPMQSRGEVLAQGAQDWGPRYLDVDLSEQYVRMFDENSNIVMESECVSGDMALGTDTVTGVFTLEDKKSPMMLIGLDDDGDGLPDYENEVQFWMPFYGGYGLHDALWRGYFGGNTYQYDGSHGCVNLPYSAAEILYSYIKVGDVVVVHW